MQDESFQTLRVGDAVCFKGQKTAMITDFSTYDDTYYEYPVAVIRCNDGEEYYAFGWDLRLERAA